MSDKRARANYYLGSSIMIAAVVIGLVMAIPATPAITSQMGIMGHVVIKHLDSEGNILSYQQTDNTIVIGGMDRVRDANIGNLANGANWNDMQIGETVGNINNEGLDALIAPINQQEPSTAQATTQAISGGLGATATQTATFTITAIDNGANVREAGLFDGDAGVMLSRVEVPNPFTVFTDDQVELDYTIIYG